MTKNIPILKMLVLSAALLAPSSARAISMGYEVKMELYLSGKHVFNPHFHAPKNKMVSVKHRDKARKEDIIVEAIVSDVDPRRANGSILMKFVIKSVKDGKTTVILQNKTKTDHDPSGRLRGEYTHAAWKEVPEDVRFKLGIRRK